MDITELSLVEYPERAAVTNYVTTRFGTSASNLSAADIAKMRRETAQ